MIAPRIKTIIVLLSLAFKCRLANETGAIVLVQAGTQANQLAGAIDCASDITNLLKIVQAKVSFFQDSKKTCSLIFVSVIKKVYLENIPFVKTIHII